LGERPAPEVSLGCLGRSPWRGVPTGGATAVRRIIEEVPGLIGVAGTAITCRNSRWRGPALFAAAEGLDAVLDDMPDPKGTGVAEPALGPGLAIESSAPVFRCGPANPVERRPVMGDPAVRRESGVGACRPDARLSTRPAGSIDPVLAPSEPTAAGRLVDVGRPTSTACVSAAIPVCGRVVSKGVSAAGFRPDRDLRTTCLPKGACDAADGADPGAWTRMVVAGAIPDARRLTLSDLWLL
jgi:hypothetical protein